MKGYVIELHATFAYLGDDADDAEQKIFDHIDLNETAWESEVIEELSEDEFEERFGSDG